MEVDDEASSSGTPSEDVGNTDAKVAAVLSQAIKVDQDNQRAGGTSDADENHDAESGGGGGGGNRRETR